MTRSTALALLAGLLCSVAAPALAQDDTDTDPSRVEVPEAGVSIAFPVDWSVDVEMREREDWGFVESDEDEPLVFWNVVYASAAGWPWCDLTWYPQHPMSLEEHALLYEELMTPTYADVERPIEMTPVSLPAGEAYRFVIYNEPTADHTTTYLLEGDGGRYLLRCSSEERADDDWLGVAQSLELLVVEAPDATTEP
jgi:hypothetical protein